MAYVGRGGSPSAHAAEGSHAHLSDETFQLASALIRSTSSKLASTTSSVVSTARGTASSVTSSVTVKAKKLINEVGHVIAARWAYDGREAGERRLQRAPSDACSLLDTAN